MKYFEKCQMLSSGIKPTYIVVGSTYAEAWHYIKYNIIPILEMENIKYKEIKSQYTVTTESINYIAHSVHSKTKDGIRCWDFIITDNARRECGNSEKKNLMIQSYYKSIERREYYYPEFAKERTNNA